jgi:hypothetical protein
MTTLENSSPVPVLPSGVVSATDYGPLGTEPKGTDVLYWKEPEGGTVLLRICTVVTVVAIFVIFQLPLYGVLVALCGGLAMYALTRPKKGPHHDYICDDYGITRRYAEGKIAMPSSVFPWSRITGLAWLTRTETVHPERPTANDFHIHMQSGPGLTIDASRLESMFGFMEFVDAHTPQLSYRWVDVDSVNGAPIQTQLGKYARIAR